MFYLSHFDKKRTIDLVVTGSMVFGWLIGDVVAVPWTATYGIGIIFLTDRGSRSIILLGSDLPELREPPVFLFCYTI